MIAILLYITLIAIPNIHELTTKVLDLGVVGVLVLIPCGVVAICSWSSIKKDESNDIYDRVKVMSSYLYKIGIALAIVVVLNIGTFNFKQGLALSSVYLVESHIDIGKIVEKYAPSITETEE